jgi:hypothetical protein
VIVEAVGAPAIGVSSSPEVIVEAGPLVVPFADSTVPPGGGGGGGLEMSPRVFLPLLGSK